MRKLILFFLIVLLISIGCTEDSISPTENYSVSGNVLYKGNPVENAVVSIDDDKNLQTQTDEQGEYKFVNIPKGNYNITVSKSNDEGGFTERSTGITVENDVTVESLILPSGVKLYQPENVEDIKMLLKWSMIDANDFREYKIYQHLSSGLDETTGELIHVSTQIDDTSFSVKNLNPLTEYFFRVYVMNDFGRLGGSNITFAETENKQIIKNGNFEILNSSTGFPENWQAENFGTFWLIDSNIVFDGKYSLSTHDQAGVIMPWQSISPADLVAGSRYSLSYWIKHDALQSTNYLEEFAIYMDNTEFTWSIQINPIIGPKPESDWKEYKYEFTMPSISSSNYNIRLYFALAPETYAWIDKLSLVKVF
jgi:hypothetical protein